MIIFEQWKGWFKIYFSLSARNNWIRTKFFYLFEGQIFINVCFTRTDKTETYLSSHNTNICGSYIMRAFRKVKIPNRMHKNVKIFYPIKCLLGIIYCYIPYFSTYFSPMPKLCLIWVQASVSYCDRKLPLVVQTTFKIKFWFFLSSLKFWSAKCLSW